MIHICIPAHNEAQTIGVLLWKIRKVMADFRRDYAVLVLDDASTDGTGDAVERYRRTMPIRLIRAKDRMGYPAALERLIRRAVADSSYPKRDAVVTLQADFTESPEYIVPLVKTLEGGADIVAGAVRQEEGEVPRAVRWTRRAASVFMGPALRQAPVSDPICGFRAYRVIVLKKALRAADEAPLIRTDGWGANLELLSVVAPHARRIEEVPLSLRFDLRSRESRFRPFHAFKSLYRARGRTEWQGEA